MLVSGPLLALDLPVGKVISIDSSLSFFLTCMPRLTLSDDLEPCMRFFFLDRGGAGEAVLFSTGTNSGELAASPVAFRMLLPAIAIV